MSWFHHIANVALTFSKHILSSWDMGDFHPAIFLFSNISHFLLFFITLNELNSIISNTVPKIPHLAKSLSTLPMLSPSWTKRVAKSSNFCCTLTGCLHVPIVGPTGQSDWSVRLVGPTIVSCKRFVRPVGQMVARIKHVWFRRTADPTVEACGHYVRPVCPTGLTDSRT